MQNIIAGLGQSHNNAPQKILNTSSWPSSQKMVIPQDNHEIFFNTIIKSIPAALAVFHENLNYLVTSARWSAHTGLNSEHVIGRHMYDVIPDMPKKWKKIHERALKGERLKSEEDIFKRENGMVEWFRWEVLPWYKTPDEVGGIILFVEQITRRKQLEKDMQKMIRALNQSNAELERFAHICAHDLNEPLRTIANYSELLSQEIAGSLTESARHYLSNIHKSIQHMHHLIYSVLAYSQFESKPLRKRQFLLSEILENVSLSLQNVIKEKNACLNFSKDSLQIYGDAALFAQLMQNLVSNALKFNNSEMPVVDVNVQDKGGIILISVKDNGIGIATQYHKSIFRIFNRLHPASKYPGTGIGLCICKKIVDAHGGKIWVESLHEGGSIFYLSLPKN